MRYVDNFFIPLPHLLTHSPSHFLPHLPSLSFPPIPPLSLKGNRTFNRNFSCRFCYQLPEDMKCCEPNTTCNVSQSQLVNLYISRISSSLASQTHFAKKGKCLVNCVYKPCPAALYSAVQSHCSILSHDALHHGLSSNGSLSEHPVSLSHKPDLFCSSAPTTSSIWHTEVIGSVECKGLVCETTDFYGITVVSRKRAHSQKSTHPLLLAQFLV